MAAGLEGTWASPWGDENVLESHGGDDWPL